MINNSRNEANQLIHERLIEPARRGLVYPDEGDAVLASGWYKRSVGMQRSSQETFWQSIYSGISLAITNTLNTIFGRVDGLKNDEILVDVTTRTPYGNKMIPNMILNFNAVSSNKIDDLKRYLKSGKTLRVKIQYDGGRPSECTPTSWKFDLPTTHQVVDDTKRTISNNGQGGGFDSRSPGIGSPTGGSFDSSIPGLDTSGPGFDSFLPSGGNNGVNGLWAPPSDLIAKYVGIIIRAAGVYGIDPCLVAGVIAVESHGQPLAVSKAGAAGLCQMKPETFAEQVGRARKASGLNLSSNLYDITSQIYACANYLNENYENSKSWNGGPKWELAISAYNSGPGNTQAYASQGFLVSQIPETIAYVQLVKNNWGRYKDITAHHAQSLAYQRQELNGLDMTSASTASGLAAIRGGGSR